MRHSVTDVPPRQWVRGPGRVAAAMLVAALASCAGTAGTNGGGSSERPGPGGRPAVAPDLGAGPAEGRAALASCPEEVWPGDGSAEATHLGTHEGASVFEIAARADAPATIVVVGKLRPGESCLVMEPSGSAPPVTGSLWPLGGRVQAVLLGPAECNPEFCPGTVLIRDGERALGALYLPETCDRALTMDALSWFTGQDSLRLTCHQSAGAGHRELVYVLHVGASGLVPVFGLETGTAEAATEEERATPGFCERRPVGWVRLVEKGERPVIKVFDPGAGEAGEDGKGTGLMADFRFDPGTRRFEQIGPGKQEPYDARAWCKK